MPLVDQPIRDSSACHLQLEVETALENTFYFDLQRWQGQKETSYTHEGIAR